MSDPARSPRTSPERIEFALGVLREAVFQSRARQAANTSLLRSADATRGGTNCGLGAHALIETQLSQAGREHASRLWPVPLQDASAARAAECIAAWVERQDALDRQRNHFLRDFRRANGFDRAVYSAEQLAVFEAGLARVNDEEERQRSAAGELLARIA